MTDLNRYTCEEVFRRLNDYLDRTLRPDELRLVEQHLEACARCASEYAFERSLLDEVREKLQRIEAPPDLLARIAGQLERLAGGFPGD